MRRALNVLLGTAVHFASRLRRHRRYDSALPVGNVTTATTGPATTALAAGTIAPRLAMTTSAPGTTMGPIVLTVPEVSAQAIEDSSVAPGYEYSTSIS